MGLRTAEVVLAAIHCHDEVPVAPVGRLRGEGARTGVPPAKSVLGPSAAAFRLTLLSASCRTASCASSGETSLGTLCGGLCLSQGSSAGSTVG